MLKQVFKNVFWKSKEHFFKGLTELIYLCNVNFLKSYINFFYLFNIYCGEIDSNLVGLKYWFSSILKCHLL